MKGPPPGKHRKGHKRPMTDREKRKAVDERRARLLGVVPPPLALPPLWVACIMCGHVITGARCGMCGAPKE